MKKKLILNKYISLFNFLENKLLIKSIKNTFWCLIGCSIGDFGTILFFQFSDYEINVIIIMILAIINGIITSIALETFVLLSQMNFIQALKTATGMSLISMLSMEISMNLVDLLLIGEAKLVWWVIPIMLLVGFFTPLPYNYWRLKKYNVSCH
ncbi:MAG: hypothetical protein CFH19_00935 [Alphaproteobacteria bacterium MarineAlpha5_Bin9]|nr:MAG: hypothetical protein CFH19_00935 [Alphaproteobacteria bacterium MarineAlpha5_Bin9]|tara:strand:- start:1279 stop:1737 length:459 start_codon:yes stop_codon:yes gene_type:complete